VANHEQVIRAVDVFRDFGGVAADGVVALPGGGAMTGEIRCEPPADLALFDLAPHAVPYRCRRAKAVLLPGLAMRLVDEASGESLDWKYEGGMAAYLQESLFLNTFTYDNERLGSYLRKLSNKD
jgi:hypothetical protein